MGLIANIRYIAKNFETGLGDVSAKIYDPAGALITTVNLSEIDEDGVYAGSYVSGAPAVVTAFVDSTSKPAPAVQKYELESDTADLITEIQEVAGEVWGELTASHSAAGSFGALLQEVSGPGFNPGTDSLEDIRDAIDLIAAGSAAVCGVTWDIETASHTMAGSFGKLVQDTDTSLGAVLDAAGSTGSAHAKLAELLDRIGVDADAANPDTLFEYLESIQGSPQVSLQDVSTDLQTIISSLGLTAAAIRYKVVAPAILERPEAGTTDHVFYLNILDSEGGFADPDGDLVWVNIEEPDGTDIVASAALSKLSVGRYSYVRTVDINDVLGQELFHFNFDESGSARIVDHTVFVQDKAEQATVADLVGTMSSIGGVGFVEGTDSLEAIRNAIDTNDASIDSQLSTILNEILDIDDTQTSIAVWDTPEASHNQAGSMGELIHEIDTKANDIQGAGFATASHSLVEVVGLLIGGYAL